MEWKRRTLIVLGLAVAALLAATGLKSAFGRGRSRDYVEPPKPIEPEKLKALARAAGELGAKMARSIFATR
jgi:hypothetical protein